MGLKQLFTRLFYNDVIVEVPDAAAPAITQKPVSFAQPISINPNILDETIIISCYFNPVNAPYRLKAFNRFYEGIKQYNHKIVECVIGKNKPQLPDSFEKIYTSSLLWHKETLLNNIIKSLPAKYKYIFWVDADIIFTNPNWLEEGAKAMAAGANIVQPFEYCVHLEKDRLTPDFNVNAYKKSCSNPMTRHKSLWRSFCSNFASGLYASRNYDAHGHVGFVWGIKREVYDKIPGGLYDKALIGGADHIMAHAAAGQINNACITESFSEEIDSINTYSRGFYAAVNGKIGYALGDIYHIWHGDVKDRQYLKRIKDFAPIAKDIDERDDNGLYIQDEDDSNYMLQYLLMREALGDDCQDDFVEETPGYIDNSLSDTNWINGSNQDPNFVDNQGNSGANYNNVITDNNGSVITDNNRYNDSVIQDNSSYNIGNSDVESVRQDNTSFNITDNNSYQGSTFS